MKKSTLKTLLGISISFSILGFILDLNERAENAYLNLFEIAMMAIILFVLLTGVTKIIHLMKSTLLKNS